jgi:hypothetical protein
MVQYHFRTNEGPSLGPIDVDEFRQRQEAGEINDDTMVWRSGMADWTNYANLRALEQKAAEPRRAEPPPLPVKAASTASRSVQFLPCGTCNQEWPEHLLEMRGSKHMCGNCRRRHAEEVKKAKLQNSASGVSSGWGMWILKTMALAAVCGGLLYLQAYMKFKSQKAALILQQHTQPLPPAHR